MDLVVISRLAGHLFMSLLLGFLFLSALEKQADVKTRLLDRRLLIALVLAASLSVASQLLVQSALLANASFAETLRAYALGTWSGKILACRMLLGLVAAALLSVGQNRLAFAICLAFQFVAPLSGHALSAPPSWASFALHGIHVALASLWFGSLAALSLVGGPRELLTAFSARAAWLIMLTIGAGIGAAYLQVEQVPALLGTAYGQILLIKVVLLLVPAMMVAAWLRWRFLRGKTSGSHTRVLGIELVFGIGVLTAATLLSQIPPARHSEIVWPLPFRFAPKVALMSFEARLDFIIWSALAVVGLVLTVIVLFAWRQRRREASAVLAITGLCGALALYSLTVTATPTSYAISPQPFEAQSIARAKAVFLENCASCHGRTGHGDGIVLSMTPMEGADLTKPHTNDHTMTSFGRSAAALRMKSCRALPMSLRRSTGGTW